MFALKQLLVKFKQSFKGLWSIIKINAGFADRPHQVYPETFRWCLEAKWGGKQRGHYQEIYPSSPLILRSLPQSTDSDSHWQFQLDYGSKSQAAFVATIPKGRFWHNCAVITPDNQLLGDASIYYKIDPRTNPYKHPAFQKNFERIQKIKGTVAVLSAPGGDSYFHWLFDVLPRIHLLQKSQLKIDQFIVNSLKHSFQRETLELLKISLNEIIDGSQILHLQADQLVVPSLPRHQTCNIAPWVFKFIRDAFLPSDPFTISSNRRLYISRAKANRRKLLNEIEVVSLLKSYNFECIELEQLTFIEQVRLLSEASYVVAPHGAGLTNIVFCSPGTKVIEIYSPNYVSVSYWNISTQIGLEYYCLFGEGDRPPAYTEPHHLKEDITVNLKDLVQTLELAQCDKSVS